MGIVIHACQEIVGLRQSREGMGQHTVRGKEIGLLYMERRRR